MIDEASHVLHAGSHRLCTNLHMPMSGATYIYLQRAGIYIACTILYRAARNIYRSVYACVRNSVSLFYRGASHASVNLMYFLTPHHRVERSESIESSSCFQRIGMTMPRRLIFPTPGPWEMDFEVVKSQASPASLHGVRPERTSRSATLL